jgi:hypothetical protein
MSCKDMPINSFPEVQTTSSTKPDIDHILFKHDRIYTHNIMRVNYTTYDVRRAQDTINPATPHRDIMVLADIDGNTDTHRFLYTRVLGVYHVNVIYTGPEMIDYRPRRLEFLWVRWFEHVVEGSWTASTLDCVCFPPMAGENAYGFLDPTDVIRGSYIVPTFAKGKRYIDGRGLSRCAQDSQDWLSYYVDRYSYYLFDYFC